MFQTETSISVDGGLHLLWASAKRRAHYLALLKKAVFEKKYLIFQFLSLNSGDVQVHGAIVHRKDQQNADGSSI